MSEKISIKINIADRFYPLTVDASEEEKIRKAAKLITDKLLQYKQRFSDKDTQDFLAMALLQFATRNVELEEKNDIKPLRDNLQLLKNELDNFLIKETK